MERKEPGIICCGKGFLSGPLFRFAMRSFMFALQLAAVSPPLYSQSATELGSEGDLVVLGTGGTALDPNVKIKGFTVFGSTQPAYTGAVTGNGNVVINGVLAVSSGAYFVGNSTFTGANKIFVNDGSSGQILGKNTGGWLEWFNAGAIGDDLGNHTAVQDLLMAGFSIVNAASGTFTQGITASSFTAAGVGLMAAQLRLNPANNLVISSETSAALGAGVRVSTNIYIVGFSSAAKYYGDGASLTGVVSDTALGTKVGGNGTADWVAKFQGSGNAITDSSIYDNGTVTVLTNPSSVTVYGKDAASGYSLALSSGINMPNGTVNAGQVRFNPNIAVSSEPAAAYGGGVRVSTNVYIVGFSSAAKYYGDGSSLTGIAGDNLGNHNATQRLNMAGNQIVGVSSLTVIAPDTLASSLWVSTSVTTPHLYVSTNGNVGINTASPQSLFQAGEAGGAAYNLPGVAIIGDNASNALGIVGSSSLTNINLFISGLPNRTAVLQSQLAGTDGGTLDFWTKPDGGGLADRMRIDQDGNIGIGTTSPGARLEVAGGSATFRGSDANAAIVGFADAGGNYRVMISTSGNVGVGTIAPEYSLDVNGDVRFSGSKVVLPDSINLFSTTNPRIGWGAGGVRGISYIYLRPDNVTSSTTTEIATGSSANTLKIGAGVNVRGGMIDFVGGDAASNPGSLIFRTGTVFNAVDSPERARIDSAGNVGISTGAPQARLDVLAGGAAATDMATIWRNSAGTIVSSVSATGVMMAAKFIGDGSGITGLTGTGDNLGNHVATTTLNMSSKDIVSVSTISVSSITTAGAGVIFSTHVYFVNGNVGIGTTVPDRNLTVNAGNTNTVGLDVLGYNNTGQSGVYLQNSLNNGMFLSLTNSAGTTTHLFRSYGDSYVNTGNVGIGTTGPGRLLHLEAADNPVLRITSVADVTGYLLASSNDYLALISDTGGIRLGYGSPESFTAGLIMDGSGNVGIGTTAPGAKLHAVEASGSNNYIFVASTATDPGSYKMVVSTTGNIGVGTTNPSYGLEVVNPAGAHLSTTSTAGYGLYLNPDGNVVTGGSLRIVPGGQITTGSSESKISIFAGATARGGQIDFHGGGVDTNLDKGGALVFRAGRGWDGSGVPQPERMRIDYIGNVGLSTGAPQARLDVLAGGSTPDDMAQIWRKGDGVIIGSMSATGVMMAAKFIGDGSGITGLTGTGDNLGNHVATTTLNMSSKDIVSVSTISVSSITTAGVGVIFSTHVYFMNGNVGIGTTAPGEKLHVYTVSGHSMARIETAAADGTNAALKLTGGGVNADWNIGTNRSDIAGAAGNLFFNAGSGTKMVLQNDGNVGIGTTGPDSKLVSNYGTLADVSLSDIRTTTALLLTATDPGTTSAAKGVSLTFRPIQGRGAVAAITAYNDGANKEGNAYLAFSYGSGAYPSSMTEAMRITSGNVGIGTAAPEAKLHIVAADANPASIYLGATGTGNAGIVFDASNGDIVGGDYGWLRQNDDLSVQLLNLGTNPLNLGVDNSVDLSIISGGNVGIGTTEPAATLHVSSLTNTNLILESTTTAGSTVGLKFITNFGGTPVTASITNSWSSTGMLFTAPRDIIQAGFHFKGQGGVETMHIETQNNGVAIGSYADQSTPTPSNGLIVSGNVGIGTASPGARLQVDAGGDGVIGQIIKANSATQSANLTEWRNSGGGALLEVTKDGYLQTTGAGAGSLPLRFVSGYTTTGGGQGSRSPFEFRAQGDGNYGSRHTEWLNTAGNSMGYVAFGSVAGMVFPQFISNQYSEPGFRQSLSSGYFGITGANWPDLTAQTGDSELHVASDYSSGFLFNGRAMSATQFQINRKVAGAAGNLFALSELGVRRMLVDDGGRVAIGAGAPGANLHISSTSAAASQDMLKITTGAVSADVLVVKGNGNVGIGTTGPGAKLQVTGGDAAVSTQGNGLILKATDGANCFRVTLNNVGTLATASVTCP